MREGNPCNILLADDDVEDCQLFEKALKGIPIPNRLKIFSNGEELMNYLLKNSTDLPDVLFLDLSMPQKTGFECLIEIKENKKLKNIPVFVFTTSIPSNIAAELELSNMLINFGALDYIRKPADFEKLELSIHQAIIKVIEKVA